MGGTKKVNRFMTAGVSSCAVYLQTINKRQGGRAPYTNILKQMRAQLEVPVCVITLLHDENAVLMITVR
jgi:hypothetical protein